MNRMIINSADSLDNALTKITDEFLNNKYIAVSILSNKRSIDSNALQFHWYKEMEQQGDMTAQEYRSYCKYHYGCSIRSESDPYFAKIFREILKKHRYEDRIKIMSYIDITSTFDSSQMSRYLTSIENGFRHFKLTSRK